MGFFSNLDIAIHEAIGTPQVQAGRIQPGQYFQHNDRVWRVRGWYAIDGIPRVHAACVDRAGEPDGYFLATELVAKLDV